MLSYDLDVATQGLLSNNSLQIGIQGLLKVEIDIIVPPDNIPIINYSGLPSVLHIDKKDKKKAKKRIKVTAIVDNKEYIEYAYFSDLTVTIKDINIKLIEENNKPKIIINLLK